MKTILYTNGIEHIEKELKNSIHTQAPEIQVKIYNSIEQLSQTFRQPLNNVSVVILLITSKDELVKFNLMNALFDNIRVILILPDRQKDMLALGLKLKTSFVSYIDNDLQDVVSVLRQIFKISKENKQNG